MLHDYEKIIYFGLTELWFVSGKSDSRTVFCFFMIYLQNGVLSTIHALTGCDTTNKVVVTRNEKLLHNERKNFYLGFVSGTFTNHRTAGEEGGHSFNSSLPLPPASQTLRH